MFFQTKKSTAFVNSIDDESTTSVGEVDVVPMINVVFLLLIFFMVVGVFRSSTDSSITLPKTQANNTTQLQELIPQVLVNQQGEFLIDGKKITARSDVLGALQNLNNKESILIRADAEAPANDVVFVFQLAADAGFTNAGLQTVNHSLSAQQ